MAVIYSQVTEVKLNDVWLWPNQCKDMKKYNLFVQWILIMGERRRFPIPMQTLYAILNFLLNVNTNNQWSMKLFWMSFSKLQSSKILQFWFSKFWNKSKNKKLERKDYISSYPCIDWVKVTYHEFHFRYLWVNNNH